MMEEHEQQKSFEEKSLRGSPQKSGGRVTPETMTKVDPQANADLPEQMFVQGKPILKGDGSDPHEKETLKSREQIPV